MTSSATVLVRTISSPAFCMRAAILLGALALAPTPALAEMQVRGSPDAVRLEARDTPVEEILAALSRAFGMHYQVSANLDKRLSGTYVGSLSRVVTRILDGYNFVLKTENGTIAVTVLGTPGAAAAAPVSSGSKVVRQPTAAAPGVQRPPAVEGLARPAAAPSTAAPSPTIELAEKPAFPTPVLPASGAAPAPVPQMAQSGTPAPAPPALGSTAAPAPEPVPSTSVPSHVGLPPLSAPPRAQ